jgi:hypothetical protein
LAGWKCRNRLEPKVREKVSIGARVKTVVLELNNGFCFTDKSGDGDMPRCEGKIDREFKTIDFLTLIDLAHMPDRVRVGFFT